MSGLNFWDIILTLPWILVCLIFHEFCHAWASNQLGDPTPKLEGRLSLNPLVHIDIIGLLAMIFLRFGWARPVQVNPRYYKNPMKGIVQVSLAGPAGNIILAFLLAVVIRILLLLKLTTGLIGYFYVGLWYAVMLGIFNLVPIPPLDGSKVLRYFLHGSIAYYYDRFESFGIFILLLLLILGGVFLTTIVTFCANLLVGQMF